MLAPAPPVLAPVLLLLQSATLVVVPTVASVPSAESAGAGAAAAAAAAAAPAAGAADTAAAAAAVRVLLLHVCSLHTGLVLLDVHVLLLGSMLALLLRLHGALRPGAML